MKTLRIAFCILSAICLAAAIPIGVVFGLPYLFALLGGAAVFAILMFAAKGSFRRVKPQQKPDFMNSDEENVRINHLNEV